jgi:hypothetical protein
MKEREVVIHIDKNISGLPKIVLNNFVPHKQKKIFYINQRLATISQYVSKIIFV